MVVVTMDAAAAVAGATKSRRSPSDFWIVTARALRFLTLWLRP
jgi:hypothetical protein